MKGAKGGKRDRIISFLFSKKNKEKKEQVEQSELTRYINKSQVKQKRNISRSTTNNDEIKSPIFVSHETSKKINEQIKTEKNFVIDKITSNNDARKVILHEELDQQKKDHHSDSMHSPITDTSEPIPKAKSEDTEERVRSTYTPVVHSNNIKDLKDKNTSQIAPKERSLEFSVPIIDATNYDQKDLLEKSVVEALERIIKEDIYELEQIQYELEILKSKENDESLTDEVEKLKQRLEELIIKFEKIKDLYYKSIEKEDLTSIDDEELYRLVTEYKENYKDSNLMDILETELKVVESYVNLIEQIIYIENETDELDEKIDDKLDKFQIRDDEFEKMKQDFENVEEINDIVDSFNREQEKIMKEIEEKMKASEEITSKVERTISVVPHFNRLIQSAILFSMSKKIPPTPTGYLIKTQLMISAIGLAAHFITTDEKERKITTIKFQDFSRSLENIGKNINDIILRIDDAFYDISLIRENFKKVCEEYAGQIPEYDELMKNLDRTESELKEKQDIAKKYSDDFDKMLQKNNARVKKLEMLEHTQKEAA